jgi:hypothetical protein
MNKEERIMNKLFFPTGAIASYISGDFFSDSRGLERNYLFI